MLQLIDNFSYLHERFMQNTFIKFYLFQVTVSTVNMLTTVLNDSPIFPENEEEQADLSAPLLMDSPQV